MKIIINDGTSFLITDELGDITEEIEEGLFYQDTRFLSGYKLLINGQKPVLLSSRQINYFTAHHYLTNPPLEDIPSNALSVTRFRLVGDGLHEDIDVYNHHAKKISCFLQLKFAADFADIFEVKTSGVIKKGISSFLIGEDKKSLSFTYRRENFIRKIVISFSRAPKFFQDELRFDVSLEPDGKWHLCIDCSTLISEEKVKPKYSCSSMEVATKYKDEELARWVSEAPDVTTDYEPLEKAYKQSLIDLASLRLQGADMSGEEVIPAAGIPWFMTFFGRDTLITAYQTLVAYPQLAKGALKALARYQGKEVNFETEEEPGKILHEIRFGELATLQEIPQTPYYGTVDATPLFLILLSETYKWTRDNNLLGSFKENAKAALNWINEFGDKDGDGYVEYCCPSPRGLTNQGWKDSKDAVRFKDGRLGKPPVALCEVQGYVYDAKIRMAEIFEYLGESKRAEKLKEEAQRLKECFNKDFWLEKDLFYAEALDRDKNKIDSTTSNVGHLLWSGIVEEEKARLVVEKLFSEEMFSGWGIRTLSIKNVGYNPLSYHNGSVWPHDNSLIAAGLYRYGFFDEAKKICSSMLEASSYFPGFRLPELFCGFPRKESIFPVEYPTSCSPQAWASGAIPLMLTIILGISIDPKKRQILIKPVLPDGVGALVINGMKIAQSQLDLKLTLHEGKTEVEVLRVPKGFEVNF